MRGHAPTPSRQRGLGLVELMVSLALGLFLVASGAALLLGQMTEQRRQLIELQLTQDLRHATDLIVHDLRRAGYQGDAAAALRATNPYTPIHPAPGDSTTAAGYSYHLDSPAGTVGSNERPGIRLHPTNRTLDLRTSGAATAPGSGDTWQALTDPARTRITALQIRHDDQTTSLLPGCRITTCPTDSSGTCPPQLHVRVLTLHIEAASALDASVRRSLDTRVRLRNDHISGSCPT